MLIYWLLYLVIINYRHGGAVGVFNVNGIAHKRKDKQRLLDNIASLSVVRVLDYLIPLVTLPYLVRVLGLEAFGLVNYALAFALYFSALMQYGFSITAVRAISLNRDDLQAVRCIFSETLTAIIVLVAACAVVYFLIIFVFDSFRQYFYLYAFSFLYVSAQALFPLWFFQGMENMRQSAAISIVAKLGIVLAILIWVRAPADAYKVPAFYAIAYACCALFSLFWMRRNYQIAYKLPSVRSLIGVFRQGRDAFAAQLAPNLYNNSSTFFLGLFFGASSVGVFSAAAKVIEVFNSAGLILSQAAFPYLSRNKRHIKIFHRIMLVSGAVLSAICWLFADWLACILFSCDSQDVGRYIRFLAVGVLFCFANLSYHNNFLMLICRDDVVRKISVTVSLVFFVIGLFAVPHYGIYGSVLMLVGARFVMALWGWVAYVKMRGVLINA